MCARDNGVEILFDGELKAFLSLEKSFIYPIHPQPELAPKSALEAINEQKVDNANKVEPKFHERDWIISNNKKSTYQVIEVKRGIYVVRDNADNHEYHIGIEECEKSGRLWTIQDAKEGDVLYSPEHNLLWIYKDKDTYYVATNLNYPHDISIGADIVIPSDVRPATKDRQTILFERMKEAGYEWDAEKKELKKIEDEPKPEPENYKKQVMSEMTNLAKDYIQQKPIWKPTKEQINAIRLARSFVTDDFSDNPTLSEILLELEKQLKNIMEGK